MLPVRVVDMDKVKETDVKHTIAAITCAGTLIASLAACGGGDAKSAQPSLSSSSKTATNRATPPAKPLPTGTKPGPAALPAHSTYTYGGLKVAVNLPADIPSASRPSLQLFSDFVQAMGRTTAWEKLDPTLSRLASADVVKDRKATITAGSTQGIGSVTYTIREVQTGTSGFTMITGCLDQSELAHLRKDGSHFVAAGAKKHPTLNMTAIISRGATGSKVTSFTFAVGPC
jgi:hypothetical protein